jgi:hypothetical protein
MEEIMPEAREAPDEKLDKRLEDLPKEIKEFVFAVGACLKHQEDWKALAASVEVQVVIKGSSCKVCYDPRTGKPYCC